MILRDNNVLCGNIKGEMFIYNIKENSIVFLNINIPDNNQFNDISSLVKIN